MLFLAAISLYAAWASAALAMPGHWRSVMGSRLPLTPPTRRLRGLAIVLAALALALCVRREGPAFGTLTWICLVCVSAWLWLLTLVVVGRETVKPRTVTASGDNA